MSDTVVKVIAGAGVLSAAVIGMKMIAARSERKPDATVEESYAEFAGAAELVEIRPGRRLRVLVAGETKPGAASVTIFLVHGSCARMAQFYDMMRCLKAKDAAYRFVAFDAFGCGESPQPYGWDVYSTEEHRKDLEALFDKYAAPQGRNVLVGHSFGTSQVLFLDSKHATQVKGLVLIGTRTKLADGTAHPIFRLPLWILDIMQASCTQAFHQAAFHPSCEQRIVDLSTKMSNLNRMYMCKAFYKQIKWVDADVVKACKKPVLVLQGRDDLITPLEGPEGARAVQEMLPQGQLEVVEQTSHQVMMEKPEDCAQLLHTFIQKLKI